MTRRLFPWRRDPREAVHPGRHRPAPAVDEASRTVDNVYRSLARDAWRPGRLVHLPPMRGLDTARPAADVPASAAGQPTGDTCHGGRPHATVEHVGATEAFGDELRVVSSALAQETGLATGDDLVWEQRFADLDRRLVDVHAAFLRRWRPIAAWCDRIAPGWRSEPRVPAADFDEARKLATGEIPVCTEVGA